MATTTLPHNAYHRLAMERLNSRAASTLYILVTLLVYEGMLRKFLPALNILVFFAKDLLCLYGIYLLLTSRYLPKGSFILKTGWQHFFTLFFPLAVYNTLFDPILPFFAAKQYMLYIVVGLLVPMAFSRSLPKLQRFLTYFTLMVIPTFIVASIQNTLSPEHWINRSVGGDSLENFSAGGFLRVSSTFSFTGQYSWFLNAITPYIVVVSLFPYPYKQPVLRKLAKVWPVILVLSLIAGAFATGGRTAVVGCSVIALLGLILSLIKAPKKLIALSVGLLLIGGTGLFFLRSNMPELFVAYDIRSAGSQDRDHVQELGGRITQDLFGWTTWISKKDGISFLFGNGLGIMSNGVDKISSYAYEIRKTGFWTENDWATTAWEGGIYLILIWYGFRIWVINICLKLWWRIREENYAIAISFLLAYIVVIGLYGTLATQPPLAIWWWLCVGMLITLYSHYIKKEKQV